MKNKDVIAIILGIICLALLGSSYFIGGTSADFQSIISWCTILMILLTIVYLYFVYLRKQ